MLSQVAPFVHWPWRTTRFAVRPRLLVAQQTTEPGRPQRDRLRRSLTNRLRHDAESGTSTKADTPAETYSRFDATVSQRTAASTARCASSNALVSRHAPRGEAPEPRTTHKTSPGRVMVVLPARGASTLVATAQPVAGVRRHPSCRIQLPDLRQTKPPPP